MDKKIQNLVRQIIKEDFDYNNLFKKSDVDSDKTDYEYKKQTEIEKNSHARNIHATGNNWNDATLFRVNSVKADIDKMIKAFEMGNVEKALGWYNYALEDISQVDEMGFEAKEYAKNLKNILLKEFEKNSK